jgi:pyruvate dehydrogenase E1 component
VDSIYGRGVLRGGYRFGSYGPQGGQHATLLGSGAIFTEVVKAAQQLAKRGVGVDVFNITSWSELVRDGGGKKRPPAMALMPT